MAYEIKDLDSCSKQISVTIPADEVSVTYEECIKEARKAAQIPGFRKGKVPRHLIEKRFHDYIKEQVAEKLIPETFRKVLEEAKLNTVGEPAVEKLEYEPGKDMKFEARVEFLPDYEIKEYKGLIAEKLKPEVSEEDVDKALDDLRQKVSTLEPVEDRASKSGDFLTCDVTSVPKDVPDAKPQDNPNAMIELGDDLMPEFRDALTGVNAGEEKSFEVSYPDDHRDKNIAGRTISTTAKLLSIKTRKLPPLDDSFVKLVTEDEKTLSEYRDDLKKRLMEEHSRDSEDQFRRALLRALCEKNPVEFPPFFVERQMDAQINQMAQGMMYQGMDPQTADIPWQELREKGRDSAKERVHETLLVNKLIEQEGLTVSDEDIQKEFDRMGAELKTDGATIASRYQKDEEAMENFKSRISRQKALDLLAEHADKP